VIILQGKQCHNKNLMPLQKLPNAAAKLAALKSPSWEYFFTCRKIIAVAVCGSGHATG